MVFNQIMFFRIKLLRVLPQSELEERKKKDIKRTPFAPQRENQKSKVIVFEEEHVPLVGQRG